MSALVKQRMDFAAARATSGKIRLLLPRFRMFFFYGKVLGMGSEADATRCLPGVGTPIKGPGNSSAKKEAAANRREWYIHLASRVKSYSNVLRVAAHPVVADLALTPKCTKAGCAGSRPTS